MRPFLKWAGGKRWLTAHPEFKLPTYTGRYMEPFLGGGAVFFSHGPEEAILSDVNARLIECYRAVRDCHIELRLLLEDHDRQHARDYYYLQRSMEHVTPVERAAQFIYLNRACWNGLYRVNRQGTFNVPIGSKDWILSDRDDFQALASALSRATLVAQDFEQTIASAIPGDLLFVDPPYTVAHNFNGFVKYNENIFSWADQERLATSLKGAIDIGVAVVATNADHPTVRRLYEGFAHVSKIDRHSIISGNSGGRRPTSEILITAGAAE